MTELSTQPKSPLKLANMSIVELYILVTNKCNFHCSHCLNRSGSSSNLFELTKTDLDRIADEVNGNLEIRSLMFSGGEPSLRIPILTQLQHRIHREIRYQITTNGSYTPMFDENLHHIELNEIVVSFDRYHSRFINIEQVLDFCTKARSRNISVKINFTFDDVADIRLALPLKKAGFQVHFTSMISSGRANGRSSTVTDMDATLGTCPSLETTRSRSGIKVIYFPGKGFTFCCGPLLFDCVHMHSELFAQSIDELIRLPFFEPFFQSNFENRFKNNNKTILNFHSRCDACKGIYEKR